jgi:hypothetical protein
VEKNCNFSDICVLRVAKGQRIEFCFKASYRNCESKCVNVTSNKVRLCLELFQNGQLKKNLILIVFPFKNKYNALQSLTNNKIFRSDFRSVTLF